MTVLLKMAALAVTASTALVGAAAAATKPYTITTISVPGAYFDHPVAVTSSGAVLGVYVDANNEQHGYIYQSGTVSLFDVPGAAATNPLAINASGDIVGFYTDQNGVTYGFIYKRGHYFTVGYQGYISTELTGINDSGLTCGDAYNGFNSAFTYKGGRFKQIDREAAGTSVAINNKGVVIASIGGQPAFYASGKLTYIPADGGTATGIDDKDTIVGYLTNQSQGSVAFTYSHGAVTTFTVPGAMATFFSAINADGLIAGGFEDTSFNQFVFIKKGTKVTQLPTIGNSYMTPYAINAGGVVAGAYLDSGNNSHSFVATPPQ